jgi:predicted dehydrogenase
VPLELPHKPFYEKELQLKMSTSYGPGRYDPQYELDGVDYPLPYVRFTERRNLESFLDLIAGGRLHIAPLTTHRFGLQDADKAYALIEGKVPGEHPIGVLFDMPPENTLEAASEVQTKRTVTLAAPRTAKSGRVRIGLIGAGTFTRGVLLPAFAAAPDIEFRAICTATGMTGEKVGKTYGFTYATTDYKELLADAEIDLVIITTQHRAHAAMVIAALQAGKHVFVEKPLCVDQGELDQIKQAAELANRVVHVGLNRRFSPLMVALKEHFKGVTEPLFSIYRVNAGYAPPGSVVHREGGRIIGEGCHFLDSLIYLTGQPVTELQTAAVRAGNAALVDEDSVTITARHEGGHLSTVHYLSRGNPLVPKERLEVHAGLKSAVLDDFAVLHLYDGSKVTKKRLLIADKGHKAQCKAVVEAARKGGPAPIPFADLCHVTELTFLAAAQAAGGQEA